MPRSAPENGAFDPPSSNRIAGTEPAPTNTSSPVPIASASARWSVECSSIGTSYVAGPPESPAGLVARTMFDNVEYRSADANGWPTSCQDSRFEPASAFDKNGSTPTKEAKVATRMQDGSELADALLKRIGETVGDRAKVSTVFGEPVEREGIT